MMMVGSDSRGNGEMWGGDRRWKALGNLGSRRRFRQGIPNKLDLLVVTVFKRFTRL